MHSEVIHVKKFRILLYHEVLKAQQSLAIRFLVINFFVLSH